MTAPQNEPNTEPAGLPVPKRQLNRRRLLRLTSGGILALMAGGSLRTWRVLQEPVVTFPPVVLPHPNAYDGYVKAVGLLHKSSSDRLTASFRAEYAAPTGKNRHEILPPAEKGAVLRDNASALAALRAALTLPYHEPPKRDGEGLYPQLSPYRTLARLCITDGDVKRSKGRTVDAASAYLDAVQMGQDMVRGGPFITRLVGIATQQMGRRPLWKYLDEWDGPSAKYAAKRMEAIIASHVPMAETWAEEKYFGQAARLKTYRSVDEMAQTLFGSEEASFEDAPPATAWQKARVYAVLALWSKTSMMDGFSSFMDDHTQISRLPYARRSLVPLPPDPLNCRSLGRALSIFETTELKDVNSSETQNALLCAALALQAFRADHSHYPAALDELVTGGYLSRVPADPFSPDGNRSLCYRKLPIGRLLWSVGPDGKDDNGTPITDPAQTGNARYFVTAQSKGDLVAGTNIF